MSERQRTTRRAGLLFAVFLAASNFSAPSYAQGGKTVVITGASQALQARVSAAIAPTAHAPLALGAPALTAAERARVEYWSDRLPLRGPDPRPATTPMAAPAPSSATVLGGPQPMALGAFQIRQNTNLLPIIPAGFSSSTNEPSTAMAGRNRFQTGNWYAAYSSNAGASFTHLSPFTAFPSIDGGFCCDQDTLYDPGRSMFIWFLQYIKSGSLSTSRGGIRIALFRSHTANISNAGWISYVIRPNNLGGPASGEWFDYPHLALGEDFLYLAINVFTTTTDTWTRTIFMRIDLDQLRAGGAIGVQYISSTSRFNFTPVQGAKDVMYFASQVSGSLLQILRWPENSNIITAFNRNVVAWLAGGTHLCPGPDGNDFCRRSDNRVLAGALGKQSLTRQQEIWFFWNVRQGGNFPKPYIEGARFRESDLAYVRRPLLWNANGAAFHYIGAAPNSRGDVGLSVAYNTPGLHVSSLVCLEDDFTADPPGWSCFFTRVGAHGPASNRWGDYLRVRPAYPADRNWVATGFTLQANTGTGSAEPRHIVFGRQRDTFDFFRWFNR